MNVEDNINNENNENFDDVIEQAIKDNTEDGGDDIIQEEEEDFKDLDSKDTKKEPEKKEDNKQGIKKEDILGKTPEEIQALIEQKAQEAFKAKEKDLQENYNSQQYESQAKGYMKLLENKYGEYQSAVDELDNLLQTRQITPQQYRQAVNRAVTDMQKLKADYVALQQYTMQPNVHRVKRTNDTFYEKLEQEMPELKDEIVKKYAKNLKDKVFDVGGIEIAQGGFSEYVKEFIAASVREAEARGYQKAKNEFHKQGAKAKASSVVQSGDSRQSKPAIRTADDILKASKEDLLNHVLNE